jgi:acyl carrier protein
MGLDSVELLFEHEQYFGIRIPDREAEGITTVQKMVDTVARHLGIVSAEPDLRSPVLQRIQLALQAAGITEKPPAADALLKDVLFPPDYKNAWKAFEAALGLEVPRPDFPVTPSDSRTGRMMKSMFFNRSYAFIRLTMAQLVDAVCAANYQVLIDPGNIRSTTEIYAAVSGICINKLGIDPYEIAPEKTFTGDFGID